MLGVLPPQQAAYRILSGHAPKAACTEAGATEPPATFGTCFGAPFLPLPPHRYDTMLGERLAKQDERCWLVNASWSGGAGVGERMNLHHTRAMVQAALAGKLDNVDYVDDPVFGMAVPSSCPDVPAEVLTPKSTWKDPSAYDAKAKELAALFNANFQSFKDVSPEVAAAGPRL